MWAIENSPSSNSSNSQGNMVFKDEILRGLFSRVLRVTGISHREILAHIREKRVIEARFIVMLALRKHGLSSASIGRMLNRDHTTILSGMQSCRRRYDENPGFRALFDEVMRDS